LLPDGRPRFRKLLIIVARQNGKTLLSRILILYWMFVERQPLILGTSSNRSYAKKSWTATMEMANENPWLSKRISKERTKAATGDEIFSTVHKSGYMFAATNRKAGRSLTLNRILLDELREHQTWDTWAAANNAMNAVRDGQCVGITNMADDKSVVLNSLRRSAHKFLETGQGDVRLGLFEYSAPPDADPLDIHALAMANPNLNVRVNGDDLLADAARAVESGGEELALFKTEVMCIQVHELNAAIDADEWKAVGTDSPVSLAPHRRRVALCLDVSLDGSHATLIAAALLDGTVHAEVVKAWNGYGCTKAVREDLATVVGRVRPAAFGWIPNSPTAALAAELRTVKRGDAVWPPRGVKLIEIKAELPDVCMGLHDLVKTRGILHPNDPLLTAQVVSAPKQVRGPRWVFGYAPGNPVDAPYALAGAVHMARTLPPPAAPLEIAHVRSEG
jgi:hypothetical protein